MQQAEQATGLVACPACCKLVPVAAINLHLDTSCSTLTDTTTTLVRPTPLHGHKQESGSGGTASDLTQKCRPAARCGTSRYFSATKRQRTDPSHLPQRQPTNDELDSRCGRARDAMAVQSKAISDSQQQRDKVLSTAATAEDRQLPFLIASQLVSKAPFSATQPACRHPQSNTDYHQSRAVEHSILQSVGTSSDIAPDDNHETAWEGCSGLASEGNRGDTREQSWKGSAEQDHPAQAQNSRSLALLMCSAAAKKLPGQHLFKHFISEKEEISLIAFIDSCQPEWQTSTFNGPHRGKAWGVRMDLQKRKVLQPQQPMPPILQTLAERMRKLQPLQDFFPNEANANDYQQSQNHYLGPHVDDRQLSTGAIVTLSLLSSSVMSFRRDKQPGSAAIRITLPPGSLQVLTREARYSYTHAIALEDFHGKRRVSVTFRQSPLRP